MQIPIFENQYTSQTSSQGFLQHPLKMKAALSWSQKMWIYYRFSSPSKPHKLCFLEMNSRDIHADINIPTTENTSECLCVLWVGRRMCLRRDIYLFYILTGGNWQKWKRVFLTCPCHEIYRDETVGLKSCKNTLKITIFVKMWNLGQYRENLIFCQ